MSELLYTEKDYWEKHYKRRFLELAYRVMKKAGIKAVIIDDGSLSGTKDHTLIRVTEIAHKQTMLIEVADSVGAPSFYDEAGTFTKEAWDSLGSGTTGV